MYASPARRPGGAPGRRGRHRRLSTAERVAFRRRFWWAGQIGANGRACSGLCGGNSSNVRPAPFCQLGEHKYGKPILDRADHLSDRALYALKIGLISMDSTLKSKPERQVCAGHRGCQARQPPFGRAGPNRSVILLSRFARALVAGLRGRPSGIPRPPMGGARLRQPHLADMHRRESAGVGWKEAPDDAALAVFAMPAAR